jgi:hypothetical protein
MPLKEDILIEKIAGLVHEEWAAWSKDIAKNENISQTRLKRWINMWVPYSELNEKVKEEDRKWAREILETIKEHDRKWGN